MTGPRPGREDWTRLNELFHRALAEPADQRVAFVAHACAGEPDLLAELTSLLAAHDDAGDFIETPLVDPARLVDDLRDSPPSLVGRTIGHYIVRRLLGEGGMGVVYLAQDTRLARLVALKALAPRLIGNAASRERLRREAQAAAALTHPGIAAVYALEDIDDHLYIATEYVAGETLRDELGRGPLPVARVLDTGLQIARALAAAHDRGIVHRDIKPENLMRTASGDVKILDFGVARIQPSGDARARLTDAGALLGTPAYMSPEQIRGQAVDSRADIFALGIVLAELATGTHPFAGSESAFTIARILESDPASRQPDDALEAIVRTCLQKAPEARFASAHALVQALEQARQGRAAVASFTTSAPRWWWQFHQAAATTIYAALLYPLWQARTWTPGLPALLLFTLALVAMLVAGTLRLHLWFTVRSYPSESHGQRRRASPWIRAADLVFVAALFVMGAAVLTEHSHVALLLIGAGVAVLLSAMVIEPSTTRAAFNTSADDAPAYDRSK